MGLASVNGMEMVSVRKLDSVVLRVVRGVQHGAKRRVVQPSLQDCTQEVALCDRLDNCRGEHALAVDLKMCCTMRHASSAIVPIQQCHWRVRR